MSIVYSNANGWIISPEAYFDKIAVRDPHSPSASDGSRILTEHVQLNPALFDIWHPYKRRKHAIIKNTTEPNTLEECKKDCVEVHVVQSLSQPLIQVAKAKRLAFVSSGTDKDNATALKIAQDFYQQVESNESSETWSEFYGENNFEHGVKTELNGRVFIIPPRTRFHCRNIESIDMHLKEQKFDLIVMDPPWRNKYIRRRKRKQAEAGYQLLENCKIEEIPVASLTNDNAFVVVWCTNCKAHQDQVVQKFFPKWGLQFVQRWYWLKVTQTGEPVTEFHDAESTLKQPFETILIGRKSTTDCIETSLEDIELTSKVVASVPSSLHSHKPPLVRVIESHFGIDTGNLNCLELFARSLLPGWTSYGNQVLKLQSTQLYSQIEDE